MIKKITAIMLALITAFAMMSISMTSASAATKVIEISKLPPIYYGETLKNSNLTPCFPSLDYNQVPYYSEIKSTHVPDCDGEVADPQKEYYVLTTFYIGGYELPAAGEFKVVYDGKEILCYDFNSYKPSDSAYFLYKNGSNGKAMCIIRIKLGGSATLGTDISVINGKASASSSVIGNAVTITADQIDDKIFYCWNITGATLEDYYDSETMFTMGVFNVSAEAVYKDCECKCHKGGIAGFFYKIVLFFQKLFGNNLVCECGAEH
ncbi:MAG: hypothetical protein IKB88_05475 [Clostridia bacterium]|nr:hypothetical protein [Clostridia bacterium]